ncbi:MAG: hypothetical protein ABH871_04815 [Pseudomonadota bacterium]
MRRILSAIIAISFVFSLLAPPALAEEKKGKLESFEDALEPPPKKKEHRHRDRMHYEEPAQTDYTTTSASAGEIAAGGLMQILYQFFLMGLMNTGAQSSKELYTDLKLSESPALPTIRIEPSYQYLIGNIHGVSGKAEAGYLMFGAQGEYLRYFEKNASDLSIISGHFLLRTMLARIIGVNIALGVKSLWGQRRHTGFDMGMPFHIYFNNHFIFDVLPYIAIIRGNNVYDIDSGLSYKYKYIGARLGYRVVYTGGQTLHGPKAGIFFQW